MLTYLLYRLISFGANLLPRPLGNWMALRLADLCYAFDRRGREAVISNLRVILGKDASAAHLRYETRWTFRSFGKYMAEFIGSRRYNAAFIDRCVAFKGLEHIHAARTAGRGVVLVGAHIGNWEIGGAALSFRGLPVLAIIQPHPNPRVHRFFMSQRESHNFQTLPVGSAALPILRHLKANGIVAVLGDRPYGEEGLAVDFFGRPALFAGGPARLALATGAAFIPTFVLRRFDDSFMIIIEPPVPHPDGPRPGRAREMTQAFARILEGYVRDHPSHWLPFFPVWEGSGRAQADPRNGERPSLIPNRARGPESLDSRAGAE
jgi:lauroyl/myristoyl acyltransferase